MKRPGGPPKIVSFLNETKTLDEIANQWFIYKKHRQPESFYLFGERGMVGKHLENLIARGLAAREGDLYYKV